MQTTKLQTNKVHYRALQTPVSRIRLQIVGLSVIMLLWQQVQDMLLGEQCHAMPWHVRHSRVCRHSG